MPLTVFHPPNEDDLDANAALNFDIVAVHGLNGDSHRTWTSKESKKLWLRDFLPHSLPTGRTMTFGYDATAAFQNSVADIEDHARDLLGCLAEKRQNGVERRPLIFVAHSLGGHVVKQALVLASRETRYSHIFNNTNAVIFFGTPHQGSDLATYGRTLARIPSAIALVPPPGLLESLVKGSLKLQNLTDDFMKLLEMRAFQIVSFYETKPLLYVRKLVVTKKSALLTPHGEVPVHEHQVPVAADHRKMCQFESLNDKTYKIFITNVRLILRGEAEDIQNEHFIVSQVENPNFTGRSDIRHLLYESILKDRHMRKQSQDRFVLYGLGGSGKTQVCLKFAHDHRNSYKGIFWIDASTQATAKQSFLKVARACNQEESTEAVKGWLSTRDHWLLIIDNADDPALDLAQYFPASEWGTIIITTRNPDSRKFASSPSYSCHVDRMSAEDGVSLLLKTALKDASSEDFRQLGAKVVKLLGCLALAIVQAGAVLRQNICSLDTFCDLYTQQKKDLLESGRPPSDYDNSVYTTWEISVKQIQIRSATDTNAAYALELLQMFSFLHFDGISEQMFERASKNRHGKGAMFSATEINRMMPFGWDQLALGKTLKILLDFSLITIDDSRRISMHPLVHEWSRDRMTLKERENACERAMATIAPSIYWRYLVEDVKHAQSLVPHIDACLDSPEGKRIMFADGLDMGERFNMIHLFASVYEDACRYHHAIDLHRRNLRLKRLILPSDNPYVLHTRRRLAFCLGKLYKFDEAVQIQESVLEIVRQGTGENELKNCTLWVMRELADMYINWGKYEKSLVMLEEVVHGCIRTYGADEEITWVAKSSLAYCLYCLNRDREAVKIREEILQHRNTFTNMEHLAHSYAEIGEKKKARKLQQHVLAEKTLRYGEFHPSTLKTKADLMSDSRWMDRKSGIEARKKDLEIMEETLGELNNTTIRAMSNLAERYLERGLTLKAKQVQMRAVSCAIKLYGNDHPTTIWGEKRLTVMKRIIIARKIFYWWLPDRVYAKLVD